MFGGALYCGIAGEQVHSTCANRVRVRVGIKIGVRVRFRCTAPVQFKDLRLKELRLRS